jgi:predicted MFS family arabinose efflux permease
LGIVLFCAGLPRVAFLLFAGVIADRGNRVRLLVIAEAVMALTYGVSALLLVGIRVQRALRRDETTSIVDELVHGWREFTARRWVWLIVVTFSIANVGSSAAFGVVGPVIAATSWDGAKSWGFVLAAFSLGMLVGVFVAMKIRPRHPLLIAMVASPLLMLPVLGLVPPMAVAVVAAGAFLGGVGLDVFEVLWQTALQQHVPQESLSRVSAYDYFGSLAFTPLGLAAAGPIIEHWGARTAAIMCVALMSVQLIALFDPQIRRLRANDAAAPQVALPTDDRHIAPD